MTIEIDAELHRRLFAGINEQGFSPEGWTRAPWTDELRAAEQLVIDAAVAGGMVCEHDPAGNLWITDPQAPADGLVATGSHLDTVPKGGAFDGTLGVVGGLVAVLALRAAGVPNAERLAVISFADEEGSRFNTPCFGSRTMVGTFGDEVADATDKDGISIRDVGPQDPTKAAGLQRRIGCYFEIHVEQGLALDPADVSLGPLLLRGVRCQTSRDAKERPVVKAKGVLRFATLLQVRHRDGVYVVVRVYPEDRPLHIGLTKVAPAIAQIRLRRDQTLITDNLEDSGAVVERDGVGHLARRSRRDEQ